MIISHINNYKIQNKEHFETSNPQNNRYSEAKHKQANELRASFHELQIFQFCFVSGRNKKKTREAYFKSRKINRK